MLRTRRSKQVPAPKSEEHGVRNVATEQTFGTVYMCTYINIDLNVNRHVYVLEVAIAKDWRIWWPKGR